MIDESMDVHIWNYGFERHWVHEIDETAQVPYIRSCAPGETSRVAWDVFACGMVFLALALAGSPLPSSHGEHRHENSWTFFYNLTSDFVDRRRGVSPRIPPHFSHLRSFSPTQAEALWGLILKMTEADARDVPTMKIVLEELRAIGNM